MKTNKSFSKRIRVTKNGKTLTRKAGHSHFNAKESRKKQLNKKKLQGFNIKSKDLNKFMPH